MDFLNEYISNSPEETLDLGTRIAAFLVPGSVIALNGQLGAGKTLFTKGIAKGLGINETITSPTYTIISEYHCEHCPALYHIDAYRLNDEKDFEDIGGPEIINSDGISIIEWSEHISKCIPENVITVSLEITGHFSRLIKIKGLKKI